MKLFDTRPQAMAAAQPGEWVMVRETRESVCWATVSKVERMKLDLTWVSWQYIPNQILQY